MSKSHFYTGGGDQGKTTRLGGKSQVKKSSLLIATIGAVDEATSCIGVARASAQSSTLRTLLPTIQRHIIQLMAHLSADPDTRTHYPGLGSGEVLWLEEIIAELEIRLAPLHDFVLPGESTAGAFFHVARTVVRRAERKLVSMVEQETSIEPANIAYLNRLSSLLFVAALIEDEIASTDS